MFFVLSKVLGFFAEPSNLLISAGVVGALLLLTRLGRVGARLMALSIVLLAIFGFSPLGDALILPLEERFPKWNPTAQAPAGIIVLGGAFDPFISSSRGELALGESAERMVAALELARRYPATRLLFSGGDGRLFSTATAEAEGARDFFLRMGVAADRLLLEDRSRNTVENAVFSKAVAEPKPGERWLLITSAFHMPRAVGVFRKVEFAVEPYPVDWRTSGSANPLQPFERLSDGLRRTDTVLREWVGLLIYWLTGRTSALFPGP
jgi:uncharacterized SAM-binding protein YcdF (DUF218 family)